MADRHGIVAATGRSRAPQGGPEVAHVGLRPTSPLVSADDSASRSLVAVIAILTFLAALAAAGADIVAASSSQWRSSLAGEATIQITPQAGRDLEGDVATSLAVARAFPGIAEAKAMSKAEAEDLLSPWLGHGLDLDDLPVPRLIVLKLDPGRRPDLAGLTSRLAEQVHGAIVDDHGAWLSRLSVMADTIVVVAVSLVVLVLIAAALAVAFATRGAMVGNREAVEVLHFVGAGDRYIAREFGRRFLRLGLEGGALGAAGACLLILASGYLSSIGRTTLSGAQLEALFGTFAIGWRGYAAMLLVAAVVAAIAGFASRRTVRRYLDEG